VAERHLPLLVADDDERVEAEPPAALDDARRAADPDHEVHHPLVAGVAVAAVAAPFTCHVPSLGTGRRVPGISSCALRLGLLGLLLLLAGALLPCRLLPAALAPAALLLVALGRGLGGGLVLLRLVGQARADEPGLRRRPGQGLHPAVEAVVPAVEAGRRDAE